MRDFLGISQDYSAGGAFLRLKRWEQTLRRRVPSGTTEAQDRAAILSSLRDSACLRFGVPALKRWAILGRPFGTETLASMLQHLGNYRCWPMQKRCLSPREKNRPSLMAGEAKHFSPSSFLAMS